MSDPSRPDPAPFRNARGLYLLTPDEPDTGRLLARVSAVLPWAACLQYRNKSATPALRRCQAEALRELCHARGVALIVNDSVQLALDTAADGVHLGEHDGSVEAAAGLLGPGKIVGASCYDDLARAQRAVAAGADYVAFGAFFPSSTKPNARRASPQLLRAASALPVPRVAIGGITAENAPALVAAGADLVAVVSGVFDAPDPVAAARAYAACFAPGAP